MATIIVTASCTKKKNKKINKPPFKSQYGYTQMDVKVFSPNKNGIFFLFIDAIRDVQETYSTI